MTKQVCRYDKCGYCMFGEKCKFAHNNIICNAKNCDVYACEKRHPKSCHFFMEFGKCKFTDYWKFHHGKSKDVIELENKVENIIRKTVDIERRKKVQAVENKVKEVKAFEDELARIEKSNEEKDKEIAFLKEKIKDLVNNLTKMRTMEKKVVDLENNLKKKSK